MILLEKGGNIMEDINTCTPQPTTESYFDGKTIQLIGWRLLGLLLTGITLGIGAPWAYCMILRWEAKHTVVNGKRLCFTGRGLQLLGKFLLWGLLTVITLGIYIIFIPVRMYKWRISHTRFAEEADLAPTESNSTGLIIGVVCGVVLFLLLAGAAALFFLPTKAIEKQPEPSQDYITALDPTYTIIIDNGSFIIQGEEIEEEQEEEDEIEILYIFANGGLNMRSGPGKEYDVIGNIPDGTPITVVARENGWVYTGDGWCSEEYLKSEPPQSNIASAEALVGSWLVVSEMQKFDGYDMDAFCRAGELQLRADGSFYHNMCDLYHSTLSDTGWFFPGGETSGGDCPYWKGTYTFNGSHLVLNYEYENVSHYNYESDGSPIYMGSTWEAVSETVNLRVSMSAEGNLLLGYAADIPVYTERNRGSAETEKTLFRMYEPSDSIGSIAQALDRIYPG
jgi:hypothetical protein